MLRILVFTLLLLFPLFCLSQNSDPGSVRSSAAYSELLLRKTELQADLESFIEAYTEANPRIIDLRFELSSLDRSMQKVLNTRASEAGKLTLALGKLLVKKAVLETDHAKLSRGYSKDHPEVVRARKRVEIFESAVAEILK